MMSLASLRARLGEGTASAVFIGVLSVGSKSLGLLRELLLAWAFGTTATVDALRLGLTYTTYFSHLFFGEAMSGAVVPRLVRLGNVGPAATDVKRAVTVGILLVTVPIGLVFLVAPELVTGLLAPALKLEQRQQTINFLRLFGLSVPLYSLTSIAVMVRQASRDLRPMGIRPVGQNVFLIGGIAGAFLTGRPLLIPMSFLGYYILLLMAVDRGELLRAMANATGSTFRTLTAVSRRWLPLATALMILRSNILVERYFGSRLSTGSIAALDYARTVTELPMLVLAVPTGAVLLTTLSRSGTLRLNRAQRWKLAAVGALTVLWSLFVLFLAQPVTELLFKRGAFDAGSVASTATAVQALGIGAWALALGHLTTQYLMATSTPWAILIPATASLATNIGFALVLVPRLELFGLGLASSMAAVVYLLVAVGQMATREHHEGC